MRSEKLKAITFFENGMDTALTMDQLYNLFLLHQENTTISSSDSRSPFEHWALSMVEQGQLLCRPAHILTPEDYAKQRVTERKNRIEKDIIEHQIHAAKGLSKAEKKKMRKTFPENQEYLLLCEAAFRQDPVLEQLSVPQYQASEYAKYLASGIKDAIKSFYSMLNDYIEEKQRLLFHEYTIEQILVECHSILVNELQTKIDEKLRTSELFVTFELLPDYDYYFYHDGAGREPLNKHNLEEFLENFTKDVSECIDNLFGEDFFVDSYIPEALFKLDPDLRAAIVTPEWQWILRDEYDYEIANSASEIIMDLNVTAIHLLSCLKENPAYADIASNYYEYKKTTLQKEEAKYQKMQLQLKEKQKQEELLKKSIVSTLPDSYKDLYPLARQIKRQFFIHVGPTNSGKTYHAMQALRAHDSGIYLAPLRLLAFEQFETLNRDGYPCNLITGEERNCISGAKYQASTIEIADYRHHYEIAVIDEAQMIEDINRGNAWTSAILGLFADEIHICTAPQAVNLLIKMIEECQDDWEVIEHHRDTKLVAENIPFYFPASVQDKDALIVFSQKQVHAVASELQRQGIRCSIIYGNLPYDVRQEEARKFLSGETSILVATDAIGMGMNLPIRRVVFLETIKFDGKEMRLLKPEEIQQIAGRAGRKGMYETGYVNVERKQKGFLNALKQDIPQITNAVITFPDSLLGIDAPLSDILIRWNSISPKEGYIRRDINEQIRLCKELEIYTDQKQLIYDFITMPFNYEDSTLKNIWYTFFHDELKGNSFNYKRFLPDLYQNTNPSYLNELEENYRICDLLYFYMMRFHKEVDISDIMMLKKEISEKIIAILKKQKLISKRCKYCKKPLPWNHRYSTCEACHRMSWL